MSTKNNNYDSNNKSNKYSTNNFIDYNDSRWVDLNLSHAEITTVYNICCKFINRRDQLEDILQTACIELLTTFRKYTERKVAITNRTSFIRRVVTSSLIQTYIRKFRRDLIYHTTDVEDGLDSNYDNEIIQSICGDNQYLRKRAVHTVETLIEDSLNIEDATIAYCYFHMGYTQAEIAEHLSKSQSVISNKLAEIRIKIQDVNEDLKE